MFFDSWKEWLGRAIKGEAVYFATGVTEAHFTGIGNDKVLIRMLWTGPVDMKLSTGQAYL